MDIGLECYISGHNGFCGQIKTFCQDFIVTEIDECGEEVKLIDNTETITKANIGINGRSGRKKAAKNKRQPQDDKTVEISTSTKNKSTIYYQIEDIKDPVKITETKSKLANLVGQDTVDKLYQISSSLESNNQLILGFFDNKSDRALVHLSTRMVFPAIKTTTIQTDGQYTVAACLDPIFLEFSKLIPQVNDVETLMRFCHCVDKNASVVYDLPTSENKERRTKIHRLLAKHFGSFLESKTFTAAQNASAESLIQVRMRTKNKSFKHDKTSEQSTKPNLYTQFVLRKENMETLEAIERLSKCIGVYPSDITYAGTKDKKAITLQNMVVKGVTPSRLNQAKSDPSLMNIQIGCYKAVDKPLKMGRLQGNTFEILIRNVGLKQANTANTTSNTDIIRKCVEESIENTCLYGFVNYFGRQRFGHEEGVATRADAVGLAMLQGDMVKAVRLLLMPDLNKSDETNTAKRYYHETGDVPGTLSRMPSNKTRERLILKALHRHGTDQDGCTKALFSIPYSMRLLYVHSYTSLVWNKMASQRLREHTGVIVGDLVYDSNKNTAESATNEVANRTNNENGKLSRDSNCGDDFKSHVRVVTGEDIKENRFSIRDLLLPLSGYNVVYPTNKIGEKYLQALASDGLTEKNFRLRSLGLSLPGAYRKLIALPKDLQYKWVSEVPNSNVAGLQPREPNSSSKSDLNCNPALDSANNSLVSSSKHSAFDKSRTGLENVKMENCGTYSSKNSLQTSERTQNCTSDSNNCNQAKLEASTTVLESKEMMHAETDVKYMACDENTRKSAKQYDCKELSEKRQQRSVQKHKYDRSNVRFCDDNHDDNDNDGDDDVEDADDADNDNHSSYVKPGELTGPPEKRSRLELENDVEEPHLKLSFKLDSSCYATICLREMMKS